MVDLKEKTIVITGGNGAIGSIAVNVFLTLGANVVSISRSGKIPALNQSVKKLNSNIVCIKADVTDVQQVRSGIKSIIKQYKNIDILINAAGIQSPFGYFWENDINLWKNNLQCNLFGTYLMIKECLPYFDPNTCSKILNLSGGGSTTARPRFSAYSASKAAVVRLTETISLELKESGYNITVNAIAPGSVYSRMTEEVLENKVLVGDKEYKDAEQTKKTGGTPESILSEFLIFLASQESNYLNGRLISALWDDWNNFPKTFVALNPSSLFTLRRIDNKNYFEK